MKQPPDLTQEQLQNVLHYDKETGVFRWRYSATRRIKPWDVAGSLDKSTGYSRVMINNKHYSAHRLAWLYMYGVWPKGEVDHLNGVRHDNRIENLRDVTRNVNQQNQRKPRKNNNSGYLGVSWYAPAEQWRATIMLNGKNKLLGSYDTPEEAYEVYLTAKRELHEGCTL